MDFREGDLVECEWDEQFDQPVWNQEIEGRHSGEMVRGRVVEVSTTKVYTVFYENTARERYWSWNINLFNTGLEGWLRLVGADKPKTKEIKIECKCSSYSLAWVGHNVDCAWKLSQK